MRKANGLSSQLRSPMTNPQSLTPIIEKIEAAEEGCRELSRAILNAVQNDMPDFIYDQPRAGARDNPVSLITTSIDAIVGLIEGELPGCGCATYSGPGQSWGELYYPATSFTSHKTTINREGAVALALCASFLKAIQAERGEG